MNIMLGNLSIIEIENRIGFELPEKLKEILSNTREENCNNVKGRRVWHCYDIPFSLIVGQMDFAKEIYEILKPYEKQFKRQMNIGVDELKEQL